MKIDSVKHDDPQRRILDEEKLHGLAISWLSRERGYHERFEDREEGTKAHLDSAGTVGGRPWFIEVKPYLTPSEARHIEAKISGSFRGHADLSNAHPLSRAMRDVWDGRSVPVVAVVLSRCSSNGLDELLRMMRQRSEQWVFDWEVFKWMGDSLASIHAGECGTSGPRDPLLPVERVNTASYSRAPKATLETLRAFAQANGVSGLFDHALNVAQHRGFALDFQTNHVTLSRPRGKGWLQIRPRESTGASGLLLGCHPDMVRVLPSERLVPSDFEQYTYAFYTTTDRNTLEAVIRAANAVARDARRRG